MSAEGVAAMTKLTLTQERVLADLRRRTLSAGAYHLNCSISTLEALRRRGLVEVAKVYGDGSMPRFDVYYRAVNPPSSDVYRYQAGEAAAKA